MQYYKTNVKVYDLPTRNNRINNTHKQQRRVRVYRAGACGLDIIIGSS